MATTAQRLAALETGAKNESAARVALEDRVKALEAWVATQSVVPILNPHPPVSVDPSPPAGKFIAPTGNDTTGTGAIGLPWASISKFLATAVSGETLYCRGGTYAQTGNQGLTNSVANTTIRNYPSEVPTFNVSRVTVWMSPNANGQTYNGLRLVGPGDDIFQNAFGFYATGTYNSLTIQNCTLTEFDHTGIYLFTSSGMTGISILDNTISHCVYAGVLLMGSNSQILRNNITEIGNPANGGYDTTNGNAYGIAVTMDNGSGHPSTDVLVKDNYIDHVPLWHGLDTHGGVRVDFVHNEMHRCARGIFMTTQTDFTEKATDCEVSYNLVTDPEAYGPPGTDANTAITTYFTVNNEIHHNNVGTAYTNITADSGSGSTGLNIHDNARGETLPTLPGGGTGNYDSYPASDSAVFFNLFDEASAHFTDDIAALTSTSESGVTYRATGPLTSGANNYGATLSGSTSSVVWADNTAFDLGDLFTIEFLIKRTSTGLKCVLDKGTTGGLGYCVWFTNSNFVRLSAGNAGTNIATSTRAITDTAWHHVAITKSGSSAKIYVDGTEGHTDDTPSTVLTDTTSVLTVGAFSDATAYIPATISRLAFYKTALNASSVSLHYAAI